MLRRILRNIRRNKVVFFTFAFFALIAAGCIIFSAIQGDLGGIFTGVLALLLFLLPAFLEEWLRIELPTTLEIVALLFVFCAEILGEIGNYYARFVFWDDMLHYASGFIFAAFGFCLTDLLNRNRRVGMKLSPFFVSLVAFTFALSIGTMWEFFEFGADRILHTDMQKDYIIGSVISGKFSPDGQTPYAINNITRTVIETADGTVYTVNGYLDIGLTDTMKDLFVDFAGALLFSLIGYFYLRFDRNKKLVSRFIPVVPGIEPPEEPAPDAKEDVREE